MKRTTYILIGILLTVLVLLLGGAFYVTTYSTKINNLYEIPFSQKSTTIDATGIQSVKFVVDSTSFHAVNIYGTLQVKPSDKKTKQFYFPEAAEKNVTVTRRADTLYVLLHFDKQEFSPKDTTKYIKTKNLQFTLEADNCLSDIFCEANQMRVNVKNIKLDTLSVCTVYEPIEIDSCEIRALSPSSQSSNLKIDHSRVQNLYLNLDNIRNWSVDNCVIGTEHLTGSTKHTNDLQKGECKQLIWTPKTENAELTIHLKEKGNLTLSPQ